MMYVRNKSIVWCAGAGHRGRARVRGARALPQRLVRAVLRDAGPAQLHVRYR